MVAVAAVMVAALGRGWVSRMVSVVVAAGDKGGGQGSYTRFELLFQVLWAVRMGGPQGGQP